MPFLDTDFSLTVLAFVGLCTPSSVRRTTTTSARRSAATTSSRWWCPSRPSYGRSNALCRWPSSGNRHGCICRILVCCFSVCLIATNTTTSGLRMATTSIRRSSKNGKRVNRNMPNTTHKDTVGKKAHLHQANQHHLLPHNDLTAFFVASFFVWLIFLHNASGTVGNDATGPLSFKTSCA